MGGERKGVAIIIITLYLKKKISDIPVSWRVGDEDNKDYLVSKLIQLQEYNSILLVRVRIKFEPKFFI